LQWPGLVVDQVPETVLVQVTMPASPTANAWGCSQRIFGASASRRISRQLDITCSRPCNAGQPGWMHATGARTAQSASMPSMSPAAKTP
jgi:hypothetical protein